MPSPFNLKSFSVTFTSIRSYPDTFKVCLSAADVDAAVASNPPKIASLIGMEGGHSIGGSIDTLASM
jgi:membrane dipeptidase